MSRWDKPTIKNDSKEVFDFDFRAVTTDTYELLLHTKISKSYFKKILSKSISVRQDVKEEDLRKTKRIVLPKETYGLFNKKLDLTIKDVRSQINPDGVDITSRVIKTIYMEKNALDEWTIYIVVVGTYYKK